MLVLRVRDPPQGRAETDADAMLRIFTRPRKPGVLESKQRGSDGKLRIPVQAFQPMRRKESRWIPIRQLTAASGFQATRIEASDPTDPTASRAQARHVLRFPDADARNGTNSRNHHAAFWSIVTTGRIVNGRHLFQARASTFGEADSR